MTLATQGWQVDLIGFKSEDIPLYAHHENGTGKQLGEVLYQYRVENRRHLQTHEKAYLGGKAARGIYPFPPGEACMKRAFRDGETGCPRCRARATRSGLTADAAGRNSASHGVGADKRESPAAPPEVTQVTDSLSPHKVVVGEPQPKTAHPQQGSPKGLRKKRKKR